MQIRQRLTLQFSVVVFFFLLLSFSLIYFFTYWNSLNEFRVRLHDKAITSATLLLRIDEVDSSLLKAIDRAKHDVLYKENITVYDSADREIYTNNDTVSFQIEPGLLASIRSSGNRYFRYHEFEVSGIRFRDKQGEYVVLAGAVNRVGENLLANLRVLLIVLLVTSLAIVVATGWVYADRALKPINSLIGEVQSISEEALHQRLKVPKHNDEIGKLIRIFNGLLARIDRAFDLQRSFVSNVSHELKNPLTKITSQLEVTLLNERSSDEYKKTIESVLEDAKELNLLSSSLLDLAALHEENRTFAMTRLRVDEVLWDALEKVRSLDARYITEVPRMELPDNEDQLCVFGNLYLLRTALVNIVENACKFSLDHTARISFYCTDRQIHINVSDRGPGMDDEDLKNVFQPFYRADRTSRTKGYGIGLSLSQRIIHIYDGEIHVDSRLGVGTEILIRLKSTNQF